MASTTPCWSCRKRRVCCDLERPSCRKCTVKGIECPGYDAKRPRRWTQYVPPEDLPRAVSEPHASNKQEQLKTTLGLRQPPFCAQQDDVAPPVVVLDALAYYDARIAPDLTVDQQFSSNFWHWLGTGRANRHLILCVVALHRAVQKDMEASSDWPRLGNDCSSAQDMTMLHYHQARAVQVLSEAVTGATSREPDMVLFSGVHMLLCSQAQQGAYTPWRSHVNGAHCLLSLWGERVFLGRRDFAYFGLMMANVFGSTTTPSHHLTEDIIAQHEFYLDILDSLKVDSSASLTPVPNELVRSVAAINMLRAGHCQQTPREILSSLIGFSSTDWARSLIACREQPRDENLTKRSDDFLEGWELLVDAFKAAIIIYLVSTATYDTASHRAALNEHRKEACCTLKTSIRRLFEQRLRGGTHYKFILWPMVMAGVEAVRTGDRPHVETLQGELRWVSKDLGTLAMRDAAAFLGGLSVPDQTAAGDVEMDWDRIFARSPLFLM